MKEFEKQYKALANRRRLEIIKFLKYHPKSSVLAVSKAIKLGFKSTSKHLRILAGADMVDREQVNLNMLYFLPAQKPSPLKEFFGHI